MRRQGRVSVSQAEVAGAVSRWGQGLDRQDHPLPEDWRHIRSSVLAAVGTVFGAVAFTHIRPRHRRLFAREARLRLGGLGRRVHRLRSRGYCAGATHKGVARFSNSTRGWSALAGGGRWARTGMSPRALRAYPKARSPFGLRDRPSAPRINRVIPRQLGPPRWRAQCSSSVK
jgi:hypothetical protein